jgi:hypothetical protein
LAVKWAFVDNYRVSDGLPVIYSEFAASAFAASNFLESDFLGFSAAEPGVSGD